jgi:hypothetical protein
VTYGWAVAALGDVTGDGICDLGVGAPDEDGVGRVYLYAGSLGRSQWSYPIWWTKGFEVGGRFGEALAGGGDFDGDGISDFVIGAPRTDNLTADEGLFRLYLGASGLPASQPRLVVGSGIQGARLGGSFAPLADFNADGYADLVVGAPGAAGRVYAYFGNGTAGDRRRLRIEDLVGGESRVPRFHPTRLGLTQSAPVELALAFPAGRTRVQAEFETRLQNLPLGGTPTSRDPSILVPGLAVNAPRAQLTVPGLLPGRGYHLRSRLVSRSPYFQRTRWTTPEGHASGGVDFWTSGQVVGVDSPGGGDGTTVPRIRRIAPNPGMAQDAIRIDFVLPSPGPVSIEVYAVNGARVRRLASGPAPAGPGSVRWDGRREDGRAAPAGVYLVALRAAGRVDRGKLVRLP